MPEETKTEQPTQAEGQTGFRRLTSRKFLLPVFTTIMLAITDAFGISLEEQTVNNIVLLVIAFVGGESIVDGLNALKKK